MTLSSKIHGILQISNSELIKYSHSLVCLGPPGGGVGQPLPAAAGLQAVAVDPLTLLVRAGTRELTQPALPGARAELQLDGGGVDSLPVEELLHLPGHHHVVLHRVLPTTGLGQLQVTADNNSPGYEIFQFWKNYKYCYPYVPTSLQM